MKTNFVDCPRCDGGRRWQSNRRSYSRTPNFFGKRPNGACFLCNDTGKIPDDFYAAVVLMFADENSIKDIVPYELVRFKRAYYKRLQEADK